MQLICCQDEKFLMYFFEYQFADFSLVLINVSNCTKWAIIGSCKTLNKELLKKISHGHFWTFFFFFSNNHSHAMSNNT